MEVYDTANKLASEISNSKEFREFKEAKEQILLNPDKNTIIKDFERQRYEQQLETMTTGKNDEEKLKKLEEKYNEIVKDEQIKDFFEKQTRFNFLIQDVNNIIGNAIRNLVL